MSDARPAPNRSEICLRFGVDPANVRAEPQRGIPVTTVRAVGSSAGLATNSNKIASGHAGEGLKNLRNERPELLDAVGLREYDDDADA